MAETGINPLLGNQYHYNDRAGRFISAKHERLAEIVHDYDDNLDLVFVPSMTPPDPQYAVIEWASDSTYYINSWWHEYELDDRILVHLFENDFNKHNPDDLFNEVEARNLAKKLMNQKDAAEKQAEVLDFWTSALKSPLHVYKHNGRVLRD